MYLYMYHFAYNLIKCCSTPNISKVNDQVVGGSYGKVDLIYPFSNLYIKFVEILLLNKWRVPKRKTQASVVFHLAANCRRCVPSETTP